MGECRKQGRPLSVLVGVEAAKPVALGEGGPPTAQCPTEAGTGPCPVPGGSPDGGLEFVDGMKGGAYGFRPTGWDGMNSGARGSNPGPPGWRLAAWTTVHSHRSWKSLGSERLVRGLTRQRCCC